MDPFFLACAGLGGALLLLLLETLVGAGGFGWEHGADHDHGAAWYLGMLMFRIVDLLTRHSP